MKKILAAIALSIAMTSAAYAEDAPQPAPKMDCCEKMKEKCDCCKDKAKKDEHGSTDAGHDQHAQHQQH